jgi:glycosyltransferase involved in cell wall biosynthesis
MNYLKRKRIVFYVEPTWAFGVIHYELCKYLWNYGFDCHVLPWNVSYSLQEANEFISSTDLFVTTPHGWRLLGHNYKVFPPEKCIIISHAKLDMTEVIHYHGVEEFDRLYKYGAVSNWLIEVSKQLGIKRVPQLCPVAINTNAFYNKPSSSLRVVGYTGSFHHKEEFPEDAVKSQLAQPKFHKRGWLAEKAAQMAGLEFRVAQPYHNTFVTMPGFYKNVDAVICASTEEGAGLPSLEGGAAGKLVISTPVGHWNDRIGVKGGEVVPIPEDEFLDKTVELLSYYKNNPAKYVERCKEIQSHAQTYDWELVISYWVDILS